MQTGRQVTTAAAHRNWFGSTATMMQSEPAILAIQVSYSPGLGEWRIAGRLFYPIAEKRLPFFCSRELLPFEEFDHGLGAGLHVQLFVNRMQVRADGA